MLRYSCRSATIGSTFVARHAGAAQAASGWAIGDLHTPKIPRSVPDHALLARVTVRRQDSHLLCRNYCVRSECKVIQTQTAAAALGKISCITSLRVSMEARP